MNLYHDIDDELLLPVTSAMQLQPIDNIREDDDMLTAAVVVKELNSVSLAFISESPRFCWFGGGAGTNGVCRLGNNIREAIYTPLYLFSLYVVTFDRQTTAQNSHAVEVDIKPQE